MDGIVRVVPRSREVTPNRTPVRTPNRTPVREQTHVQTRAQTPSRNTVEKTPERAATNFLNEANSELNKIFDKVSPQRSPLTSQAASPQRVVKTLPVAAVGAQATPPIATSPIATSPNFAALSTPMRTIGREYKQEEINTMLTDYFEVPRELWRNLPIGSHIRFFKTVTAVTAATHITQTTLSAPSALAPSKNARFRPGGFVYAHTADMIILETVFSGKEKNGNIRFPVTLDIIDEIWKKPDRSSYIEITVMSKELEKKEIAINNLQHRLDKLEQVMRSIAAKII